ncbi:MAG TPA: UDP-2,3-diacylglucosamine diphosphatase, partial [Steroidobacteraceae bacterium]|nr:UDP-2,3-diacylglucosamine diphosphatase [Steroidobacteraceae bacterium]
MSQGQRPNVHVRTVFLSDIHLGSRDCRADLLLEFLRAVHADEIVLIGDIVDIWSLQRSFYWTQSHTDVLRALLGRSRNGTRVIYVPGNHDAAFRDLCPASFGELHIQRDYVHQTAGGLRLLVTHGDEFDVAVKCSPWLALLGSGLYDVILALNRALNGLRRLRGRGYWSLAGFLKSRIGNAVQYVHRFETAAAEAARARGLDGIVCGHIHRPRLTQHAGMLYCNDGDWVDSCSALIEQPNGSLELWHWADVRQR